jgi:hypothetical protein
MILKPHNLSANEPDQLAQTANTTGPNRLRTLIDMRNDPSLVTSASRQQETGAEAKPNQPASVVTQQN